MKKAAMDIRKEVNLRSSVIFERRCFERRLDGRRVLLVVLRRGSCLSLDKYSISERDREVVEKEVTMAF